MTQSLLQDVLRTQTLDHKLLSPSSAQKTNGRASPNDSDDDLVNVVSIAGTPAHSRPSSRPSSRPHSPGPRSPRLRPQGHSAAQSKALPSDPLKAFPTEISQRIFALLSDRDLARCARVSRKWARSQTLNYVWFIRWRQDAFGEEALADVLSGKWTKRESKQNWRTTYLQTVSERDRDSTLGPLYPSSGRASPASGSGTHTPKEMREEQWRADAEAPRPSKVEMRALYKELNGRKPRDKKKTGSALGARDRGGWADVVNEDGL
ncbi:hypothetical protein CERSUDRAFT_110071 [Gelatoporia subvermispora B]|uniref:F-box domain-containing protein n=1 Tax=Ceriporiopsis subvermispora (strain B) TaxID=914234 RepID=M2RAS8_CERS8|nr:hypothetical protein CERSUDRAFT_110071 [Gelatoporia subvermispora B]